jgi:hypothetical protein
LPAKEGIGQNLQYKNDSLPSSYFYKFVLFRNTANLPMVSRIGFCIDFRPDSRIIHAFIINRTLRI